MLLLVLGNTGYEQRNRREPQHREGGDDELKKSGPLFA
jgi:hypothetical protein